MSDLSTIDPIHIWLAVGALFAAIEAMGASGIGFIFAAIAAVLVAALIEFGVVDPNSSVWQLGWWFAFTSIIALVLWKPMKKWRMNPDSDDNYQNIVGDTAVIVEGSLVKGKIGKAKWSGAIMSAEIASDSDATEITENTIVEIQEIKGNTLFVAPRD